MAGQVEKVKLERVYVATPYKADPLRWTAVAHWICGRVVKAGATPVCPQLMLHTLLNDEVPDERLRALDLGIKLLEICDAVIFAPGLCISSGMRREEKRAIELGWPRLFLSGDHRRAEDHMTDGSWHREIERFITQGGPT